MYLPQYPAGFRIHQHHVQRDNHAVGFHPATVRRRLPAPHFDVEGPASRLASRRICAAISGLVGTRSWVATFTALGLRTSNPFSASLMRACWARTSPTVMFAEAAVCAGARVDGASLVGWKHRDSANVLRQRSNDCWRACDCSEQCGDKCDSDNRTSRLCTSFRQECCLCQPREDQ